MRFALAAVTVLASCSKCDESAERANSPAGVTCRRALHDSQALSPEPQLRFALRGCADIYSKPDCRKAMKLAADSDWPDGLTQMNRRCTAAYCPVLPSPKPALCASPGRIDHAMWASFNTAVLRLELGVVVDLAAPYRVATAPVRVVVETVLPEPLPPSPIPILEVRKVDESNTEVVLLSPSGGSATWRLSRDPGAAELEPLRQALVWEQPVQLSMRSDKEVTFRIIRLLMEAAQDAGSRQIDFATFKDAGG